MIKQTKKVKISESDIQKTALEFLNIYGFFWRNNTTGIYNPYKKCFMKNGQMLKGVPDILGIFKGKFIAVECKASNVKKLSEDQEIFRNNFEARGGVFYLCNDIDSLISWFSENVLTKK